LISCGIDAGSEYLKIVLLESNQLLSHLSVGYESESVARTAESALKQAAQRARIAPDAIKNITATGAYRESVGFANEIITEPPCCCRGASWTLPSTRTIIDLGSDKCTVVKCDDGSVTRIARNDRCAAGTGSFLTAIFRLLNVTAEEAGELSMQSKQPTDIEAVCTVFVESEIISLIHQKKAREDILRGAFVGLAQRIYPLLLKVAFEPDVMLIGGAARNIGIIDALKIQTGAQVFVPDEPSIIEALGAALIAGGNLKGVP
jgi:predicted CoA-substrate-specific enzyme activase